MTRLVLWALVVVVSGPAACSKPPKLAAMSGTVVDASSGEPVSGAAVVATTSSDIAEEQAWTRIEARTDRAGKFVLRSMLVGRQYSIRIVMPGYLTASSSGETPAIGKTLMLGEIPLQHLPSGLAGTVLHCATEQPLQGVHVKIRLWPVDPSTIGVATSPQPKRPAPPGELERVGGRIEKTTVTDGAGRFKFDGLLPQHDTVSIELAVGTRAVTVTHRWNPTAASDEMAEPVWLCEAPDEQAVAWQWEPDGRARSFPTVSLHVPETPWRDSVQLGECAQNWRSDWFRLPSDLADRAESVISPMVFGCSVPSGAGTQLLAVPLFWSTSPIIGAGLYFGIVDVRPVPGITHVSTCAAYVRFGAYAVRVKRRLPALGFKSAVCELEAAPGLYAMLVGRYPETLPADTAQAVILRVDSDPRR